MADSRDDRLAAGSGGTGNTLGIKDPQILLAAAAAGHKDQIGPRVAVKPPDPLGDASFGLNALYADRGEQQLYHRPAAADDILHILPGSTGFAGHDPDALRHGRQRACARVQTVPRPPAFCTGRQRPSGQPLRRTASYNRHTAGTHRPARRSWHGRRPAPACRSAAQV